MNILAPVKAFFLNRVALVTTTIVAMAAWLFGRVSQVNPAILQDEWIYVITSRVDSPWAAAPAYDLSNYLFNFIYSSTNLCGEAFYSCGKLLNIIFFTAFALLVFSVAVRFMPFWAAFTALVALYLSPLSIYVSMYLPESLYFALLALAFWLLVRLLDSENRTQWALVGGALGLAALAKPHALFSVAAFGIFLLIWELSRKSNLKTLIKSALLFGGGFLLVRLLVGLAVAGPKALNLFGSYGAAGAVGDFVAGAGSVATGDQASVVGAGPVAGAVALFFPQLSTHFLVITALLGGVLALILLAVIESVRKSDRSIESSLAILTLVWIGVMLIVVALFTGWITGNGDDHTSRVLLRYYEFLVPIAMIPALSFLFSKSGYLESKLWSRLAATAALFVASSLAFTGFFSQLQIQIADAPSVAGLISDADIWNIVGVASVVGVTALAFFPRVAPYILVGTLAVTMVGTGWVTQNQYLKARGDANEADIAGKFVRSYVPEEELASVEILANSRFEGRVASLWMESDNPLQILERGAAVKASELDPDTKWVLALGLTTLDEVTGTKVSGPGYTLYEITSEFDFSLTSDSTGTVLESVQGFDLEMGGLLWTSGNEASIKLNKDLPAQAKLTIELSAMPGIYGQEVQLALGDSTVILLVQDAYATNQLDVTFTNSAPANELSISIPSVQSNSDAGFGESDLKTGLGIGRMTLVDQ